jgi:hypothetical protein
MSVFHTNFEGKSGYKRSAARWGYCLQALKKAVRVVQYIYRDVRGAVGRFDDWDSKKALVD